jgi:hypothetical protein
MAGGFVCMAKYQGQSCARLTIDRGQEPYVCEQCGNPLPRLVTEEKEEKLCSHTSAD